MQRNDKQTFSRLLFTGVDNETIGVLFPVNPNKFGTLDPPEERECTAKDIREWRRLGKTQQQEEVIRNLESRREHQSSFTATGMPVLEDVDSDTAPRPWRRWERMRFKSSMDLRDKGPDTTGSSTIAVGINNC